MEMTPGDTTQQSGKKPSARDRLNALIAEWGPLLAIVYFSIFGIVLVGFALAIRAGFGVEGTAGTVGTWGAAWLATKLTQPLRIAATLVITPALGALLKRFRRGGAEATTGTLSSASADEAGPGVPAKLAAEPRALEETPSGR